MTTINGQLLTERQQGLAACACLMAQGDLERLEPAVRYALDNGVTVNELKEAFSQLYAYTGFPRSLNALGVLGKVLESPDPDWQEGKPWTRPAEWDDARKAYELGVKNQTQLSGQPFDYAFCPQDDYYLKAHLFGDIFAGDQLSAADREIVTVAALSGLMGVAPQLAAHKQGAVNMGNSPELVDELCAWLSQEGYTTVGMIESKPLGEMIKYTLHRSNNLYADAIAKTLAAEYYKLPATYARTSNAIRSILSKYANISLGNAHIVDGSGLSSHNLVTPRQMLEVLQFINLNDDKIGFIKLLPVADVSGTLHWRASTKNPPLAKNVTAKTGTLANVSNLMGFMTTKSGRRVPFVMYTNAISFDQKTRDLVKYHRIASPHLGHERYILENIYNEKTMGQDF